MIRSILRWMRQQSRRIHVRVILFAVLNMAALAVAALVGPLIPEGVGDMIGAGAVDTILQIIATSMLAVVTFSLTIMVTGFSRAEGQWTPRSHILLREDTLTHSVLATFLGAYLYALIAIILRAADVFGESELVVLFFTTLLVVAAIIVSIIRWILHLEGFGSLTLTARQLEARAAEAVREAALYPAQGARPFTADVSLPQKGTDIRAKRAGYVQQIFEEALQHEARALGAEIYVLVPVGRYVMRGDVLARVAGETAPGKEVAGRIRTAIPVDDVRSFAMDPVFCVTVLAEVATRALSPGVNDPGTAIDVVHRLSHVIGEARVAPRLDAPEHDRVWIEPVSADALFEASFDPIARSAGDALEVHLALSRALADIARVGDGPLREAAERAAEAHRARVPSQLVHGPDLGRFMAARRRG
ncbi:DUF2254 domain-containing protein [Roseibacterium sp. SDUM158016]|uniref:DUF2254 domain-containing protein n=1 Tax=Roseicyclus sediminis TaxID=2980997 RepID=UPI0021D3E753|nr:DUF2254 domain-containing protein [Roseibacterium sp. SDUM158016]MCU4654214.1 DUF2254 domain-containing protein [Roseibacterium sp. SDUM158016]